MIDLHCHMLPGIDDGAPDLATALDMARMAVADGIRVVACTPHIYPGLYDNTAAVIARAVEDFRLRLAEAAIPLQLTHGADTHLAPDLLARLRAGSIPSLHGTRYFLLEPPHHVAPPLLDDFVFGLIAAGYVPIITHPERLTWISKHFDLFKRVVLRGAWVQITAGSLTGRFGKSAKYWSELMLDEGMVHIIATDAHGVQSRPPLLAEGRDAAERWVGRDEASNLVEARPRRILGNWDPAQNSPPDRRPTKGLAPLRESRFARLFQRAG
jgi:protein-tyrosine phosphatase